MVTACSVYQKHQSANVRDPLQPHNVPPEAWHTLGSDLSMWNNQQYLLIMDYFSNFLIIKKLPNITFSTVINHMKSICEEYGIPEKLVTDAGTQYTSDDFRRFSEVYGF